MKPPIVQRPSAAIYILTVAMLLLFVSPTKAQDQDNLSYAFVKGILLGQGYTILEEKYADLAQDETSHFSRKFYANKHYRVAAFTDDKDVKYIDLYAFNPDGSQYTRDVDNNSLAMLDFTPAVNRYLNLMFKNCTSATPNYRSTVYLIIAFK